MPANVMVAGETETQRLGRAKGYPYARPDTSFLMVDGEVFLFDNCQWRGLEHMPHVVGRCGSTASQFAASRGVALEPLADPSLFTPVLAIGSNAGPEQLRRKFPRDAFPGCVLPVVQVELHDFDVVYSPYISSYGSCTATLEHSPGTAVSIFITYLTERLLQRMHATEGGYDLCRLSQLQLRVAPSAAHSSDGSSTNGGGGSNGCFATLDSVLQYNHKHGCIVLPLQGTPASPIAIADIPATNRRFPAATQPQMLAALRAALSPPPQLAAADSQHAPALDISSSTKASSSLADEAEAGCGGRTFHVTASSIMNTASTVQPVPGQAYAPLRAVPLEAFVSQEVEGAGLDEWILRTIADSTYRWAVCGRLELHKRPFAYPHTQLVEQLGGR